VKSWTSRTLGEIADEVGGVIRTGPFGSQLHEADYTEDGTPVVMPQNIKDGRISLDGIARIGDDDVARLAQHRLRKGDIVYGRRGDIGRRALITETGDGWLCGTGCLKLSLGDTVVEPTFLHYYLGQPEIIDWIANQAIGATLPNLNTTILRSVIVKYPRLPTQRKIAAVLSAYDDLIENNIRRIQIVEQMARTIYEEWFVRFRFPGHDKVKIVKSELGPVPEGWRAAKLADVIELAYGKALKADDREDGPYPVYGSAGVIGYHSESQVNGPGIIVGRKGNVGSVHWSDDDFFPIDTVFFVKTQLSLVYCYFNLTRQHFFNTDAAVPGLSRSQAYRNPMIVPLKGTLDHFEALVMPMFQEVKRLRTRNANLRRTRDLLLPKLISGEIDVSHLDIRTKVPA
jgi:type I restriction enzyme S subunit